jgi:hypothetical protein
VDRLDILTASAARAPSCAAANPSTVPPTIAVLDFEIEDDTVAQGGVSDTAAQERRLELVADALRRDLAEGGLFEVVDNAPARDLIDRTRSMQSLHTCNGCELEIARALGTDLVLVGWVQKVSNLILNLNAGVKAVRTGRILMIRSVDLRGNTDDSGSRRTSARPGDPRDSAARLESQPAPAEPFRFRSQGRNETRRKAKKGEGT